MKTTRKVQTYRVLAKVTLECWHDIKADSFEQAGAMADKLTASDFAEAKEELYDAGPTIISGVYLEP